MTNSIDVQRLRAQYDEQVGENWKLRAEIERLTLRVADLQQYHDWAEPQVKDHGRDVLDLDRLQRREREARAILEPLAEHDPAIREWLK